MARVALLVPIENPTVEAEMRRLLPASLDYVTARLASGSEDSAQRLIDYAAQIPVWRPFGGMELAATGFACTGSSYLIGAERQRELSEATGSRFVFAAAAIADQVRARQARRIAVISPYPDPLHQAGLRFWRSLSLDIAFEARVEIGGADTRAIYRLSGREAAPLVAEARAHAPDLILLSGTGMPTLALIDPDGPVPVISSNYCLAQALIALAGADA